MVGNPLQSDNFSNIKLGKRPAGFVLLTLIMAASLLVPFIFSTSTAVQADSHCEGEFISISLPLNDLGDDEYVRLINGPTGIRGGLYPGGSNERPPEHDAAAIARANAVEPLNSAGQSDSQDGKIVMVSIGMSNAAAEFNEFIALAEADDEINPKLAIINGAQPGQVADIWEDPDSSAWLVVHERLQAAGLSELQVQVVWLKQAQPIGSHPGADNFPAHAEEFEAQLEAIVKNVLSKYPNIKQVFLSSRTRSYTYWTGLHPEPYAFETGFSVKWLIERQIDGDPDLNFDPIQGEVTAPFLAWGPYLWADGSNPRSDDFVWLQSDLVRDCTHPSDSGELKVANLLMDFFKKDTAAAPWFLADDTAPPPTDTPTPPIPPPSVTPSPDPKNDLYLPFNTRSEASADSGMATKNTTECGTNHSGKIDR